MSIRDFKAGPLAHLPSGSFAADGAWLAIAVLAHNLARWTSVPGGIAEDRLVVGKTFRRRFLAVPRRLVLPAGETGAPASVTMAVGSDLARCPRTAPVAAAARLSAYLRAAPPADVHPWRR